MPPASAVASSSRQIAFPVETGNRPDGSGRSAATVASRRRSITSLSDIPKPYMPAEQSVIQTTAVGFKTFQTSVPSPARSLAASNIAAHALLTAVKTRARRVNWMMARRRCERETGIGCESFNREEATLSCRGGYADEASRVPTRGIVGTRRPRSFGRRGSLWVTRNSTCVLVVKFLPIDRLFPPCLSKKSSKPMTSAPPTQAR